MFYNPIPSKYGLWLDTGEAYKNIPIDRILEDPLFKDSEQSYFIQLVDFCAYALLRRERPIHSKTKYGLDKAFDILSPILVRGLTKVTLKELSAPKNEEAEPTPAAKGRVRPC